MSLTFDIDYDIDDAVQQATDFVANKDNGNVPYLVDNANSIMDVANKIESISGGDYGSIITGDMSSIVSQAKDYAVDTAVDQVTTFLGNSDIGSFVGDNATKVMGFMTAVDSLSTLPLSIPSLPSIGDLGGVFDVAKTLSINTVMDQATSFATDALSSVIPANANTMLSAIGAVQNLRLPTSFDAISIASTLLPAKAAAVLTSVRNIRSIMGNIQSVSFLIGNPNAMFDALDSASAMLMAGIDVADFGFPMGLLTQAQGLASSVVSSISSISGSVSSIGAAIGGFF